MKSIELLEAERFEWSIRTFKEATDLTSIKKLRAELNEVVELLMDPDHDPDELAEEYADCLMCLFDSAGRAGIPVIKLRDAFERKLAINKTRKWNKNHDNTYSHSKA